MASGCISNAPQPPRPPALATAMASEDGDAPAIGAIKIGARRLYDSQKTVARATASYAGMEIILIELANRRDASFQRGHAHRPFFTKHAAATPSARKWPRPRPRPASPG